MRGAFLQARSSLTSAASSTATIFSAVSGDRWFLTEVNISIITPKANALMLIAETTDGATSAANILIPPAATNDVYTFKFGERGFAASETGSRLVWSVDANATVNAVFTGYRR